MQYGTEDTRQSRDQWRVRSGRNREMQLPLLRHACSRWERRYRHIPSTHTSRKLQSTAAESSKEL